MVGEFWDGIDAVQDSSTLIEQYKSHDLDPGKGHFNIGSAASWTALSLYIWLVKL